MGPPATFQPGGGGGIQFSEIYSKRLGALTQFYTQVDCLSHVYNLVCIRGQVTARPEVGLYYRNSRISEMGG